MTISHHALRYALGIASMALLAPACAWNAHKPLVRTAPGEEMAFDRMPTSVERPVSIAMPALAPCHLANRGPDIVCALVNMDGTYYAAMRSRGESDTQVAQDAARDMHDSAAAQVATDD